MFLKIYELYPAKFILAPVTLFINMKKLITYIKDYGKNKNLSCFQYWNIRKSTWLGNVAKASSK